MEPFVQKTSITKMIGIAVSVTVLLFFVEAFGVFLSNQKFVNGLSQIHRSQVLNLRLTEVQQASQAMLDALEEKPDSEAAVQSSRQVFLGIYQKLMNTLRDLRDEARGDTELNDHFVKMEDAIGQLYRTGLERYASSPSRRRSEASALLARQAQLDFFDYGSKAKIVIRARADDDFNQLYGQRYEPLISALVMGVLFAAIAFGLGLSLRRSFSRSVENMVKATKEVSQGNLMFQAPIVSADEIGFLTHAFNRMTDSLKESTVSRQYVETVLDSMPDSLFVVRPDGCIRRVNQVSIRKLGYSKEDFEGKPLDRFFSSEGGIPDFASIDQQKSLQSKETSLIAKDGTKIPVSISASVMTDQRSGVRSLVCVAKDISGIKEAEERYRVLVETASDAIVTADQTGQITSFNRGAELSFGYTAAEVVGQSLTLILPERFRKTHQDGFDRYLKTGNPRLIGRGAVELAGRRRDGSEFPAEIVLATSRVGRGVFFSAIIRDVSERKKALEELQAGRDRLEVLSHQLEERNEALSTANKELEAFSYSVSHDLRAPLRSVDGFSKALIKISEGQLDEKGKEYIGRIRESAQRMGQLIDDLLNLSRLSRKEMHRERVDLSALARKVKDEIQRSDPARVVEWIIQPGIIVEGDPNLLQVALENLMGNSWKYTSRHPRARIEFGSTVVDGKTSYFVRDDGAGFDMSYSSKLFVPFQRLHGAREFPGTGIGLALVKRIIHRHGGEVTGKGEMEKGAEFRFTIEDERAA